MIPCQFDASTLPGSNDCSVNGLDITEEHCKELSGFHEDFVESRLWLFPVGTFLPSARAAQILISKQTWKLNNSLIVAAVRLRVASFLLKSSRWCLRMLPLSSDEQTADRCFHF